jgi:hypothetical protein
MNVEIVEELWKKLIDSLTSAELAEIPRVSSKVRENLSVVKEWMKVRAACAFVLYQEGHQAADFRV